MKKLVLWLLLCLCLVFNTTVLGSYLQEYVEKRSDPGWKVVAHQPFHEGDSLYLVNFQSQEWQTIPWVHRLFIVEPGITQEENSIFLYISGSGQGEEEVSMARQIAHNLKSPVAILMDVPNQPLFEGLWEDDLLSYTLEQTLLTGDYSWPLLFPMTKAVIMAMDTLSSFHNQYLTQQDVEFIISGGSKRGWTAWLTAAVDSRVIGLIPISYDNLDLPKQMKHQLEVFGEYSTSIDEYTQRGIQDSLTTEEGKRLASAIDPYSYLEDILQPKLIVVGTNDPYWPLAAINLYYHTLQGDTHLLYLPDIGHDAGDWKRVLATMQAFFLSLNRGVELPHLLGEWREDTLQVLIENNFPARELRLWRATSCTRDFRQASWDVIARKKATTEAQFSIEKDMENWQAFFVEGVFDFYGEHFYLSTPVTIIPKGH